VLTPGLAQRSNGVDRFFQEDWIGSTRYLTDSSGNSAPSALRYDAFGERTATAGTAYPTEFAFVGKLGYQSEYEDGSDPGLGIEYLQQRYYDPATGRFISRDPIGFYGGLNLYTYAENNPVGFVDPWGLLVLPQDPTGLGPDWDRIDHGDPNDPQMQEKYQRWVHKNGRDGLEWHKGNPNAPEGTWEHDDNWHIMHKDKRGRWVKEDEHFRPGQTIPDPVATSRWEPGLQEDFTPYLIFMPAPKFLAVPGWLRELPAVARTVWDFIWGVPARVH
jgi:RHS repeat-associated protein